MLPYNYLTNISLRLTRTQDFRSVAIEVDSGIFFAVISMFITYILVQLELTKLELIKNIPEACPYRFIHVRCDAIRFECDGLMTAVDYNYREKFREILLNIRGCELFNCF